MRNLVFALVAGAAAATAAQAQNVQNAQFPRAYIGAGVALADHDYKSLGNRITDQDDYTASAKVFGGYEIDPLWGVEAGYTDFSEADFSFTRNGVPGRGTSEGYGVYIAGKGRYPLAAMINQPVEAFGKLGVAYSHRELDSNIGVNLRNHDTGLYAGVGLQWNFHPQWAATAEYERYGRSKTLGGAADVFSISARYNF
ncbi:MAG: outer membrane beta-barrel protein [Massilia sp.]